MEDVSAQQLADDQLVSPYIMIMAISNTINSQGFICMEAYEFHKTFVEYLYSKTLFR